MVNFKQEGFFVDHPPFPKMPRFFDSEIVVTEKLDGTNGIILINEDLEGVPYIQAGSRNRWLTLENDNYGFARWVNNNKEELVALLGIGTHYGEWWGNGIQRGYNMDRKVFSLFNVHRWGELINHDPGESICDVVPFKTFEVQELLPSWNTQEDGYVYNNNSSFDEVIDQATRYFLKKSRAAEKYGKEFTNPEGYVIFHKRSNKLFKVPINK